MRCKASVAILATTLAGWGCYRFVHCNWMRIKWSDVILFHQTGRQTKTSDHLPLRWVGRSAQPGDCDQPWPKPGAEFLGVPLPYRITSHYGLPYLACGRELYSADQLWKPGKYSPDDSPKWRNAIYEKHNWEEEEASPPTSTT